MTNIELLLHYGMETPDALVRDPETLATVLNSELDSNLCLTSLSRSVSGGPREILFTDGRLRPEILRPSTEPRSIEGYDIALSYRRKQVDADFRVNMKIDPSKVHDGQPVVACELSGSGSMYAAEAMNLLETVRVLVGRAYSGLVELRHDKPIAAAEAPVAS